MTITEFCQKTAWPLDELLNTRLNEVEELFALYGLSFDIVLPARGFWTLIYYAEKGGMDFGAEL